MGFAFWTSLGDLDLEEILFDIASESERPETAERIGREIRDAVDEHARLGRAGHGHSAMPST